MPPPPPACIVQEMEELNRQLYDAAVAGDLAALRARLADGADPNQRHDSLAGRCDDLPLHAAASVGHVACVTALLDYGADAGLTGLLGMAALHYAASQGHTSCVWALLAGGAALEARSDDGLTPLCLAAAFEKLECISALLAAGADPLTPDEGGCTPVHWAAVAGSAPALQLLLAGRPWAANRQDERGRTPLGIALHLQRKGLAAARWLLEEAAPPAVDAALALLANPVPLQPLPGVNHSLAVQSLYAPLVARQPLTASQWAQVPSPCVGLGAALPAVLQRSEQEAALLVRHLCAAERARLRTAALCLAHVTVRRSTRKSPRLPPLPVPLRWHVLALALAD